MVHFAREPKLKMLRPEVVMFALTLREPGGFSSKVKVITQLNSYTAAYNGIFRPVLPVGFMPAQGKVGRLLTSTSYIRV